MKKTTGAWVLAGALAALAAGSTQAADAPRAPRVLLLAEPNKPELAARAQALIDALPAETVTPGISSVSPRLFQNCVFLIGPDPAKAEACAAPVIAAQNARYAHTVVVMAAELPDGSQRWSCMAGGAVVTFGLDPADPRAGPAWAEACIRTATTGMKP